MRRVIALMLSPLVILGMVSVPVAAEPEDDREVPLPSTTFIDSKIFDRKMSSMTKAKLKEIQIEFADKPSPNELPERLDAWLDAVDRYGGTVDIEPTEPMRGVLGALVYLASEAIRAAKKKSLYRGAKHYDAVIYYSPESGLVERVLFSRKEE